MLRAQADGVVNLNTYNINKRTVLANYTERTSTYSMFQCDSPRSADAHEELARGTESRQDNRQDRNR